MTVTVGPAKADVIGTSNTAIQKAVDRVAAAGGGTVLVEAGTYTLENSVRLASQVTLRGEGPGKTILQKAPGVISKLKIDADYGQYKATVEDASGFRPGMGVSVVDDKQRSGWTPSSEAFWSMPKGSGSARNEDHEVVAVHELGGEVVVEPAVVGAVERLLDDLRDLEPAEPAVEEGGHGDLVGGVQPGRRAAAEP